MQLCYRAVCIKTVWYCNKDSLSDQCDIIESLELDLQVKGEFIFGKQEKRKKKSNKSFYNNGAVKK